MLPALFWYLKVCRAVLIAIHSEFCYSIFIKNHVYRKQHRKDKMMYLIAGLGNPTREYEKTRHNVGFSVIDVLADKYNIDVSDRKHKALCGRGVIEGEKVLLLKPQTFMNLSGESIREAVDYYKIDPEDIIVIYDDISLEPGQLRIRLKGSAGGHNGIKNIIAMTGTENFKRIKVGVGEKPAGWDLADHVLGRMSEEDRAAFEEAVKESVKATEMILEDEIDQAMNDFNRKKRESQS